MWGGIKGLTKLGSGEVAGAGDTGSVCLMSQETVVAVASPSSCAVDKAIAGAAVRAVGSSWLVICMCSVRGRAGWCWAVKLVVVHVWAHSTTAGRWRLQALCGHIHTCGLTSVHCCPCACPAVPAAFVTFLQAAEDRGYLMAGCLYFTNLMQRKDANLAAAQDK